MIALALLILLAIVCGYGWVAYRIKTMVPYIESPETIKNFRKILAAKGFTREDAHDAFAGANFNPTVPKPRDE